MNLSLRKTARRRLKRLVADWEEFGSRLKRPEGSPPPTAEEERSFMRLKGHMASTLAWLATLEPEGKVEGFPETLSAMTQMLGQYHKLAPAKGAKSRMEKDFDDRWHEYYIFLSKLLGVKMRVAPPKKEGSLRATLPRMERAPKRSRQRHLVIVRTLPVFSIFLVAGMVYVVGSAMGLRWEEGGFVVQKPGGLADALNNVLAGLLGVWETSLRFVDPVIASYGVVWTGVMMGLLLTASLYLIFARR